MDKKQYNFHINPALQSVVPPTQYNERNFLMQNILEEGCREPLIIWGGTVVDGNNRYRICREHGIPFVVMEKECSNLGAAITWDQIAQCSLIPFQWGEMEDAVREMLNRFMEGEATTKIIIGELKRVSRMIEKAKDW